MTKLQVTRGHETVASVAWHECKDGQLMDQHSMHKSVKGPKSGDTPSGDTCSGFDQSNNVETNPPSWKRQKIKLMGFSVA